MKFLSSANRVAYYSRLITLSTGIIFGLLTSSMGGASAAAPLNTTPGASGLSISPLRNEFTIKPGQAGAIAVTLKNITGGPITAQAKVLDFESDGTSGNPKIITNPNFNDPNSIKNFLVGVGNVTLATGAKTTISIPVQAPAGATPGAYFGLIEYKAVPADQSTSSAGNSKVALSAGVSTLVFITVPGNVTERMQIKDIHVYRDAQSTNEGVFFTSIPKTAGVELDNLGNAFESPFGNVQLKNTEGKTIYTYELNGKITRGIVLPNSTRIFDNALKNIKTPGRYTIEANVSYGPGSAILIGKKTFWYIPAWLTIVIILVLLVLVLVAWLARRRYKSSTTSRFRG